MVYDVTIADKDAQRSQETALNLRLRASVLTTESKTNARQHTCLITYAPIFYILLGAADFTFLLLNA
jgi:hypothetical protein